MLTQGGNAVDAGVATVLAAGVTEQDHFGLGGEIPILIKMAGQAGDRHQRHRHGARSAPPSSSIESRKPELWEEPRPHAADARRRASWRRPCPACSTALILALEQYGTMSFAQVSRAGHRICRRIPHHRSHRRLDPRLAAASAAVADFARVLPAQRRAAAARRDVPRADAGQDAARAGRPPKPRPRATARERLRAVRDYFYKGPIAHEIAEFCDAATAA